MKNQLFRKNRWNISVHIHATIKVIKSCYVVPNKFENSTYLKFIISLKMEKLTYQISNINLKLLYDQYHLK